jgi:hypothetical protein
MTQDIKTYFTNKEKNNGPCLKLIYQEALVLQDASDRGRRIGA